MSDPSEEDDSMEEDGSEEDSGSSEEGEDEEVSGDESGSDYESVEEENPVEQNSSLIQNEQEVLSSSSDEGNERARCPVCLNRFIGQDLGVPENCDHIFCFECIKEWSTNINTCPIDRNEFSYIHMKRSPDGKIVKKVSVKVNSKGPEEGTVPEDNTHCEVCHLGDREHRLLLCDACDLAYHCDCLDPPLFHVPIEEWFCPPCSSVMTQAGDRALPSTSGFRRVIPRTSASESVRVRVQNRRTFPSTSSRASSTPRPKKRKRRTYRRCIKKVVKLARTKAGGGAGKGGKGDRTSAVIVTYSKRYRRRRKRRKTKTKSRVSSRSAESYVQSAKERIAKRLGLIKAHNKGSTVPDVRSKPGPSSQGSSKERPHSLFGVRDQLMDFSENFNESLAVPSTSTSTPRDLPERATTNSASGNLLDSILAGQTLLHTKSDNVIIRTDGSLIRKENEKRKSGKDASSSSKSVVRVGLYKTNPASNPVKSENNTDTFSMLRGALNKKKSTESQPTSRQEPGPSSSGSPIFFSVSSRKTSKGNPASKKDSSRPAKKSSDSKSKYPETSAPTSALKNSSKIDKTVRKDKSDKSLFTSDNNSKACISGKYSSSKPSTSNFSDNQIKSEKVEPSDVEGRTLNHRMDILQKRASFLEKFSSKSVASVKKENNEHSSSNELSSPLEIESTLPKISEIKIKDEPLSSEEDEVYSQSIIGPTGFDSCLSRTFKTECQESESLIGNSIAYNTVSETVNSSKTKLIQPNFIKEEIVSSDEESTKTSPKCDILVPEIKIKEEPKEKAKKKVNDLRPASNSQEKSFDSLPCTQAEDSFHDLPCTPAIQPLNNLPLTEASESFDQLPCTQAVEPFDDNDLPCTQAVEPFDDNELPCTQAVEPFDNNDLPCTQAVKHFDDFAVPNPVKSKNNKDTESQPSSHRDSEQSSRSPIFISVNSQKTSKNDILTSKKDSTRLPKKNSDSKIQADKCFDDLSCTRAVECFDDLPCTQAAKRFDDFAVPNPVKLKNSKDTSSLLQGDLNKKKFPESHPSSNQDTGPRFSNSPIFISVNSRKSTKNDKPTSKIDNTLLTKKSSELKVQAVDCFDDLPCTQAVQRFDDLPCTQAVESFDDLPCTQAVERFDDLPSTQALDRPNDLPTQVEDTIGNSSSLQGSGSLNDLPCTQLADGFCGDTISKPKLHDKSIPNKSFKTSKDSDLLATHNLPEISSRITESKMSTPVSEQEAKELPVLSEEEKILKLKQEALLEIKHRKPPPKVVGVHRNLPQVISNVPVRRPLIPKPINKSTFSFEQVKQRYNLEETLHSDTSDCITDFKQPVKLENVIKVDSYLSQSDSESTSKLRSLNVSPIALNNHAQILSCEKNKDLTMHCSDKKTVSNLMGNITNSKSVKLSYNKETLQDVSNIKANKLEDTFYQCSKEEPQSYSSTSQTTLQNNSFNTLIKKEPLDPDEVVPNQAPSKVNKDDLHIGESNMERALRLKREKNAEVLQQNAFKDIARITESPTALRTLSIKQEKNLEVMRENLLSVSETFSCSISTENNHNSTLKTKSIHVKRENDSSSNSKFKKEWSACKKSQSNFEVGSIKKEPVEEQEEAELNTSCKSSEHSKSSKADPCHKERKHIKNKDSFERSNKSSSIDKTKDRNSEIKNENVRNRKSSNKNSEKDADQKESRKSNQDQHSTKDQSKKHVMKEQDTKKTDSDRKNKESVKGDKAENLDIKSNHIQDKRDSKGSKSKPSENKKHDKEKSSAGINSNNEKRSNKEMNCERKDKHSKSYERDKKQSSDPKNMSVEKVKNGDYERKQKHSDNKKDGCKERTSDSKTKDSERDHYKLTNSKNDVISKDDKDGTKHSTTAINDTGKKQCHKESDSDRRNKYAKNDTDSRKSGSDRNPKDKRDSRGRDSDLKINNSERNQSKESKTDRGNKNAEKDRHHKERSDKSHKYVEKDGRHNASNSDRSMKESKNSSDKYLAGEVKKEESNKRHKESSSDKRSKHADIDVHYKDKHSDRSNRHIERDKCNSSNRQSEKETHMNKSKKESTHNTKDYSMEKHSSREKSRTHISEKSNTSERLIDASKIKREHTSNGEKKRPLEPESTDDSNPNKKRKMSIEISKQNLNDNSKCTSPDSTSGPDTTKLLIAIGSIKAETPLDERIKNMMSRGEFDIVSNKKRRHESICSDSNSDISRISTEVHIKSEMSPYFSPKQIKLEDSKHASSSIKGSSIDRKSSMELKEKIAAEIKSILKPFYTVGVVNKEDYKDIMRRAVPKIFLNCGNCLNPDKIKKLVLGYVAKLKSS